MQSDLFDVVLLLALPASGKSELRRYMAHLSPERSRKELHMGETVQLDDFPYVHFMRRIDEELAKLGQATIFFKGPNSTFQESRDWLTLIELINEDYSDLRSGQVVHPESAATLFMDRLDRAREKVGAEPKLGALDDQVRSDLAGILEPEARDLLEEKQSGFPIDLSGKTLVIEFARGGHHEASPPLEFPYGYEHSLAALDGEILRRAVILYVWVTPEESRRKNDARANPDDPGSILHHGVPLEVMLNDYGCDDMAYLLEKSSAPGKVEVTKDGVAYLVPAARFDNRSDLTSFLREDPGAWPADKLEALSSELVRACDELYEHWKQ